MINNFLRHHKVLQILPKICFQFYLTSFKHNMEKKHSRNFLFRDVKRDKTRKSAGCGRFIYLRTMFAFA